MALSPAVLRALQSASQVLKRLATVQRKEAKFTVGVDIGSSAVKVVVLGPRSRTGPRSVLVKHSVPLDSTQATDASEAVRVAMSGVDPSARSVVLSVSGQWVIMRIIEMPAMKAPELKQALPFEAQRYLPFNIDDVMIDGAMLGPSDAHKNWVLIIACKKELIIRRVDWIRRAGLDAAVIDVDALALANALLASANGRSLKGTRALVNVGAQLSNLVIFKDDTPYLVRDIPWGAEKLIRHTAEHLGSDPAAVGKSILEAVNPDPALISAMKLAAESLVTELQLSFDYFENRFGQPPEEVLVSGGLGENAAFLEVLMASLNQTIKAWSPVEGLPGQFAVAYGLALRSA